MGPARESDTQNFEGDSFIFSSSFKGCLQRKVLKLYFLCRQWKNYFASLQSRRLVLQLSFHNNQSSMQVKNKYVSSLDLKYLDVKFKAIHDSQIEMNSNLNEIRKSKTTQFPSIFKSMHDDTTLYTSAILPESRIQTMHAHPQPVRYQSVNRSSNKSTSPDLIEINKYKKLIAKIKSDNQLLHNEITNLYRQEKIGSKQPQKKPIRTIIQLGKGLSQSPSSIRLSPQAKQYQRVYEDLSKEDNPYRKESLQIQKKFLNNNFHKNFQNFLLSHNKRVPEFIKNIR